MDLAGYDTNEKISALLAARGSSWKSLADVCGIAIETIYNRKNKGGWKIDELRQVAKFLQVEVVDIL